MPTYYLPSTRCARKDSQNITTKVQQEKTISRHTNMTKDSDTTHETDNEKQQT
jgi:hypothetical protein